MPPFAVQSRQQFSRQGVGVESADPGPAQAAGRSGRRVSASLTCKPEARGPVVTVRVRHTRPMPARGGGSVSEQEPANLAWRKSSASESGNSIEVAISPEAVYLRHPSGAMLKFLHEEWAAFLTGARNGEFDL
jgi:hypothetical protein